MAIEIVSRWDKSKVLYRAEDAADVRAAVVEAVKSGANLSRANLSRANLSGAYLSGALAPARADFWSILDQMPGEVPALEQAIQEGKIDGSVYSGNGCACLVGTLALAAGWGGEEEISIGGWCEDHVAGLEPDGSRPAEAWFAPIKPGDKPDEDALKPLTPPQDGWVSKEQWDKLLAGAGDVKFSEGVYRATQALEWVGEWHESRTRLVRDLVAAGFSTVPEVKVA
jgi:Pentapeptide repeats (8 copies)